MQQVADLLKQAKFEIEDGYLEVYSDRDKLDALYEAVRSLGYEDDCRVEGAIGDCYLSLNLSVDSWPVQTPFFPTMLDFWQHVLRKGMPEKFYILDSQAFNGQEPANSDIGSIAYYLEWRSLLFSLKDRGGGDGSDSTLLYFISTEKGAKMYEVNPRGIELEQVKEGFKGLGEDKDVAHLAEMIAISDGHQKERRDVLRASLAELLEEDHAESSIAWLLKQGGRLRKKYQENYDVYLHKFSVNKLLSEIEEKSTDYISKINDSISSSQSKAFAIPGALIAVGALIRNPELLPLLFVCAGLLSVSLLTFVANNIHCEAYGALREQVQRSLKRYEVIKNEDAVRVSAEETKRKLLGLIDRAIKRLNFINHLSVVVFFVGVAYTLNVSPDALNLSRKVLGGLVGFFGITYNFGFSAGWLHYFSYAAIYSKSNSLVSMAK